LDQQDRKVREVFKGFKESKAMKDRLDRKVFLDRRVPRDQLDLPG
jgi:hypothetical protein